MLAYRANVDVAVQMAPSSSRTTHAATEAVDACRFMTVLIVRALDGLSKEELLNDKLWEHSVDKSAQPLAPKVLAVAGGSYRTKHPPAVRGTGYVVDCLEAALWAFHHHDTYEAANLGDDADTTAAVCGQLAGAYYGQSSIPHRWVKCLAMRATIAQLAEGLMRLSDRLGKSRR